MTCAMKSKNSLSQNQLKEIAANYLRKNYKGDMTLLPVMIKMIIHDFMINALSNLYFKYRNGKIETQNSALSMLGFIGDTAQNRIYNIERLSEDLDFDYLGDGKNYIDFIEFSKSISNKFIESLGLIGIKENNIHIVPPKNVDIGKCRIRTWLMEVWLNTGKGEKHAIKVEISDHPSDLSKWKKIIFKGMKQKYPYLKNLPLPNTFVTTTKTIPGLMANKMAAILCREPKQNKLLPAKGRDIYDYQMLALLDRGYDVEPKEIINVIETRNYGSIISFDTINDKINKLINCLSSVDVVNEFWKDIQKFIPNEEFWYMRERRYEKEIFDTVKNKLIEVREEVNNHAFYRE